MTLPNTETAAPPSAGIPAGAAALSRDLADFLVELSIAMHKHAIYPSGHPLLNDAVSSFSRRLTGLLIDRPSLSIGIARRQLIIEGVATDPNHPLLQELAQRLHRHHLGAVKFVTGVDRDELADALATLAVEASRLPQPLGLETETLAARWAHVRLFPLTYDRLELIDQADADPEGMQSGRAAQLWVGLARAALASEPTSDPGSRLEPAVVARAIDEHQREQAYDQVIVGYLLQIANELRTSEGEETLALQKRISRMVETLNPETLTRLLEMGGNAGQRRRFLLDATQGMALEAVVDLVRAAAVTEHQTISHSLVRMLEKLARHAGDRAAPDGAGPAEDVRAVVAQLIGKWSLDDPNPEAYRGVLEAISRTAPATPQGSSVDSDLGVVDPERLVKMSLEVGTLGAPTWRAVDAMIEHRKLTALLDLLDAAPDRPVADGVWDHLVERSALSTLLEVDRIDFPLVERFVTRLKMAAAAPLLDAVEHAAETKPRERIYDLLAWLGGGVAPLIVARLGAVGPARLRELVALLGRLPHEPTGFDARQYLDHGEAPVRREAVKLLLKVPEMRDETLVRALADGDDRIVYLALSAAQEGCPRAGTDVIRQRVERGELDAPLRALGIRAAAAVRTPETLQWLLGRVLGETRLLRRQKLLPQSPELLAALNGIAAGWRDDPLAQPALALAAKSTVPEIRGVVR